MKRIWHKLALPREVSSLIYGDTIHMVIHVALRTARHLAKQIELFIKTEEIYFFSIEFALRNCNMYNCNASAKLKFEYKCTLLNIESITYNDQL